MDFLIHATAVKKHSGLVWLGECTFIEITNKLFCITGQPMLWLCTEAEGTNNHPAVLQDQRIQEDSPK